MEPSHLKFHHPYEPYSMQLEFMQKMYQCIEDGAVGIFESPTGTGKSLSLICAALTWLRDDEKRRLFGLQNDAEVDWLEQAERKAQSQQLLETRRGIEEKLKAIRVKNTKQQERLHASKKMKRDDRLQEQDLELDDYESAEEISTRGKDDQALSSATLALLESLQPTKACNEESLEEERIRVIFCSRTHSQLTQFVHELKRVTVPSSASESDFDEVVKHIPLGSRKNLCINPKVARLNSTIAINERCLELQKPGIAKNQKCEYLPAKGLDADKERLEDFKHHAIAQVQDIEDIAALGRKTKLCPYYASRFTIPVTEVITLPYPLLLQKGAREALGIDIKDNIVIIDEAHNLSSAIADTLSVVMPLSHLELAQKQLLGYCQKFKNKLKGRNRAYIAQIIRLMKSCILRVEQAKNSKVKEMSMLANELVSGTGNDQIQPHKLVKYIQESKLVFKVEGYAELLDQQEHTFVTADKAPSAGLVQRKGVLAEFQSLLIALMNPASEGRFYISLKDKEPVLKYTLLDPQAHFQDVVKDARSIILAGGTMSPMSDWPEQLFSYVRPEKLRTYNFGHIIDKSNVLVRPLSKGPNDTEFDFTFNTRQSEGMVIELALTIQRICMVAPDGLVVFFPSYDYLAFVVSTWKRTSDKRSSFASIAALKQVFLESKELSVDDLLRDYAKAISTGKGALMLSVIGGKLSEGINFSDKLGRVVVCVGLPYPNINSAEWKAKVEYVERMKYEKLKKEGVLDHECKARAQAAGREYTDNTTMRAVNQSIGRAIRHKNDFAAIYLVDKRYAIPRIQAKLPAWLKESIRGGQGLWRQVEGECEQFFTEKV